jgi:hypothetical protein
MVTSCASTLAIASSMNKPALYAGMTTDTVIECCDGVNRCDFTYTIIYICSGSNMDFSVAPHHRTPPRPLDTRHRSLQSLKNRRPLSESSSPREERCVVTAYDTPYVFPRRRTACLLSLQSVVQQDLVCRLLEGFSNVLPEDGIVRTHQSNQSVQRPRKILEYRSVRSPDRPNRNPPNEPGCDQ